ncbi:hypothetical protein Rhopal_007104-T1 [Rhodotorula paludigena]|uniref:UBX domain-containing protein n=1 Tax=Rhodotorula paludigena TaxID=86838 RepID=A0AAV5GNX0_9BASI|nr:hypothetical protein Rhopal_007104-T1 [Rhodotorula paludigena]
MADVPASFASRLPGDAALSPSPEPTPSPPPLPPRDQPAPASSPAAGDSAPRTVVLTSVHPTDPAKQRAFEARYFLPSDSSSSAAAASSRSFLDLPESYFQPTPSELQQAFAGQVRKREDLVDRPLLTQKLRDRQDAERSRAKAARWPQTRIRIRFADRSQLEGVFPSSDKLVHLYEFVRLALRPDIRDVPFVLYQTPPRTEYRRGDPAHKGKSLMDLQFTPSSTLYLKFEPPASASPSPSPSSSAAAALPIDVDALNATTTSPPPLVAEILAVAAPLPTPPSFDPREPASSSSANAGESDEARKKREKEEKMRRLLGVGASGGGVRPSWMKTTGKDAPVEAPDPPWTFAEDLTALSLYALCLRTATPLSSSPFRTLCSLVLPHHDPASVPQRLERIVAALEELGVDDPRRVCLDGLVQAESTNLEQLAHASGLHSRPSSPKGPASAATPPSIDAVARPPSPAPPPTAHNKRARIVQVRELHVPPSPAGIFRVEDDAHGIRRVSVSAPSPLPQSAAPAPGGAHTFSVHEDKMDDDIPRRRVRHRVAAQLDALLYPSGRPKPRTLLAPPLVTESQLPTATRTPVMPRLLDEDADAPPALGGSAQVMPGSVKESPRSCKDAPLQALLEAVQASEEEEGVSRAEVRKVDECESVPIRSTSGDEPKLRTLTKQTLESVALTDRSGRLG